MATVTQFSFPASEVALADAFERLTDPRFRLEQTVATCDGDSQSMWVTATDSDAVHEALEADPSVQKFRQVAEEDHRALFDIDFWPTVELLRSILLCQEGVITDIVGRDGRWIVTCRYTDHGALGEVRDQLDERTFRYDVLRIHNGATATSEGTALTEDQYSALKHACEQGYFEVPRDATLEELADDLEISHQALSERIRRGVATCLASEFPVADDDGQQEQEPPTP